MRIIKCDCCNRDIGNGENEIAFSNWNLGWLNQTLITHHIKDCCIECYAVLETEIKDIIAMTKEECRHEA